MKTNQELLKLMYDEMHDGDTITKRSKSTAYHKTVVWVLTNFRLIVLISIFKTKRVGQFAHSFSFRLIFSINLRCTVCANKFDSTSQNQLIFLYFAFSFSNLIKITRIFWYETPNAQLLIQWFYSQLYYFRLQTSNISRSQNGIQMQMFTSPFSVLVIVRVYLYEFHTDKKTI